MRKIVMSWSKQRTFIGKTAANGAMCEDLSEVDGIKDKSTSLTVGEGEKLEAYATGHELVACETSDGDYEVTMRVIEPDYALLTLLGLGTADNNNGYFEVAAHVVEGDWSFKIEPKNVGGKGIMAPKSSITYTPGYSEEEGHFADLKFRVLKGEAGYWYKMYTKKAADTPGT